MIFKTSDFPSNAVCHLEFIEAIQVIIITSPWHVLKNHQPEGSIELFV